MDYVHMLSMEPIRSGVRFISWRRNALSSIGQMESVQRIDVISFDNRSPVNSMGKSCWEKAYEEAWPREGSRSPGGDSDTPVHISFARDSPKGATAQVSVSFRLRGTRGRLAQIMGGEGTGLPALPWAVMDSAAHSCSFNPPPGTPRPPSG